MKNFDKGTVVRTVLLFIALVNQTLIMFGKAALPINEDQVNTLADALYLAGSAAFTIITSLVAWYKNNYVTGKGKLQKEALKQKGLTK
ncbi:phage holin [Bacillus licheniformis]|uniref:phage holin n=1 Tax=Bacillus licheniformis TaxID=1402 RepID=UPI002280E0C1|nr:phage holin [Bacillus licheniformis]MCY9220109.1 phage holin [Bacillus licheniformis]MEC0793343.1 phage holin [Bacillus licheniformis]MEC1556008.1 phage holin [Bacillus licheniformis]